MKKLSKKERERIDEIIRRLIERYGGESRTYLEHNNAWQLLFATILSAQCTDARVNLITPLLFEKADNPYDMIKMSKEEIQDIIRPCGLSPMKSKGIYELSHILINKYGGEVPASFEALEALPAVGHKTASVVMSVAFNEPAFPVDTHIHRMMYRWNFSTGKSVEQTEKDAKRLFPKEKWNDLHLQIIYYAREYSPARGWDIRKDIITQAIGRKEFSKSKL